ncbi:MAG: SDR family NAD(P)-dependent oxidoreductase [Candidatus Thiodiazotropha sp.]
MTKTILITGSTDGIGLETAKALYSQGHQILLHGRNPAKLEAAEKTLSGLQGGGSIESYLADLSSLAEVEALARAIGEGNSRLDVLITNAGILRSSETITSDGLDIRFAVNTFAPYLLSQRLLPLLGADSRVINLSSAAQSPVNLEALAGRSRIADDLNAYAQSKLALTAWSRSMAHALDDHGPVMVAVNPGSLLGTKMVKEGFGMAGKDIRIGVDILVRAALSDEFADASGKYFDNDAGRFGSPHPDALDARKSEQLLQAMEEVLADRRD